MISKVFSNSVKKKHTSILLWNIMWCNHQGTTILDLCWKLFKYRKLHHTPIYQEPMEATGMFVILSNKKKKLNYCNVWYAVTKVGCHVVW